MTRSGRPQSPIRWGEAPRAGIASRIAALIARMRLAVGARAATTHQALPQLPVILRRASSPALSCGRGRGRSPSSRGGRHRGGRAGILRAGVVAGRPLGHRALWHFEREGLELAATPPRRAFDDGAFRPPRALRLLAHKLIGDIREAHAERGCLRHTSSLSRQLRRNYRQICWTTEPSIGQRRFGSDSLRTTAQLTA